MGGGPTGRPAVVVMAKAPVAGAVKTRLSPALSPEEAAALYTCALLDTFALARSLPATPVVAYSPAESESWFAEACPELLRLPQVEGDLGARMAAATATLFARGHAPVIVLGADTPTLPAGHVLTALDQLASGEAEVVLGPADDGGYYLVGLAAPQPALFVGVSWGSADVLAQTLARVEAAGLRGQLLPSWWDIDTPDDLRRLADGAGGPAPRTRGWLATRARGGPAHLTAPSQSSC